MNWFLKWFRLCWLLSEQKTTSWWHFCERLSLRVFHLTWLCYSMQIHGSPSIVFPLHCYVQTESINCPMAVMCSGNTREAGHWRESRSLFRIPVELYHNSSGHWTSVRMLFIRPCDLWQWLQNALEWYKNVGRDPTYHAWNIIYLNLRL
jgi:hypothetical protein